jgi:coproporphyrinogen III oxidase
MQTARRDYASIPMGDSVPESRKSNVGPICAVLVGMAVGIGMLLTVGTGAAPTQLQVANARATSVAARPQYMAATTTGRAAASATRYSTAPSQGHAAGDAFTGPSSFYEGPTTAPATNTPWAAATAFLAGCAISAFGLVAQRKLQKTGSWTPGPHATEQSDFAMCAIAAHQNVDKAPDVLSRDKEDSTSMRRQFEELCRKMQGEICAAVEECDGEGKFREDAWIREDGGGGISRVMSGGKVWEKAGVNLSVVYGTMPQEALAAATARGAEYTKDLKPGDRVPFFACGLSCVMHPRNPHCPTMHFNYRYFETDGGAWWFGGGTDITPAYLDEEDMKHFHGTYKAACDKHDPEFYAKYKKWADEYFVIQHRKETRGLGGIFFDDLNDRDPETIIKFSEECLKSVVPAYIPIINKNKEKEFSQKEKEWQLMRRGRYVEFNLVYDRGTIFGLKTGGRIESILMSLPETARWEYDHHPEPGSPEAKIMECFQNSREWV